MQISGRISYPIPPITKGVPAVGLYLDWDYDNDPNTGYTPYYGGNTRHVDYDLTDNNGYYYFSFTFTGSQPANQYAPIIRVYANNANSAAFDGDLGLGAKFPTYSNLNITNATTYVFSNNANIDDIAANQGGALRHLYRARQFSINSLGFTPSQIRYYIDFGLQNSFFCKSGSCSNAPTVNAPRIYFNRLPNSHIGYHEYGHYIEYAKVGFNTPFDWGGGHWFRRETEQGLAFVEGWAEFCDAATHMYWYSVELPAKIEPNAFGDEGFVPHNLYQFLDASQGLLIADRNNTEVEGAVASFLYSLWDDVTLRAPEYTGDNDDIAYLGSFILNQLFGRYNVGGQLIASTHIAAYRQSLLNALNSQNDASVNVLYGAIIDRNGSARSATPTSLQVSGASSSRTLSWNDNTCPNTVTYQVEGNITRTYDLVENQEAGFRVYRKATSAGWNGTLDGYTVVATVGANVANWTDNTSLTGSHSYIVVAYNNGGNSLPKAEFTATYSQPFAVNITGVCCLGWKEKGTWTANPSGGNGSYTYEWRYRYNGAGSWSYVVGTSQTYQRTMLDTDFELQVKVTSQGQSVYDTKYVYYEDGILPKTAGDDPTQIPEQFSLEQNYPNPFNPTTEIDFALPVNGHVTVSVFTVAGQKIRTLVDGQRDAGYHFVTLDGKNQLGKKVASGIYIYRIHAQSAQVGVQPFASVRKMTLLR